MLESILQKQCEDYLTENNILYIHISNNANSKYRRSGSRKYKGWPDLTIFMESATVFIELKTQTNLTIEQVVILDLLKDMGYNTFVINNFEVFKKTIDNYKK
jgi:hypothetical protein